MCKCTPGIRTPYCGSVGCEWPKKRKLQHEDVMPGMEFEGEYKHTIVFSTPSPCRSGKDYLATYKEEGAYYSIWFSLKELQKMTYRGIDETSLPQRAWVEAKSNDTGFALGGKYQYYGMLSDEECLVKKEDRFFVVPNRLEEFRVINHIENPVNEVFSCEKCGNKGHRDTAYTHYLINGLLCKSCYDILCAFPLNQRFES